MPLLLATHTVDQVTAKVPLTIIMLLDYLKKGATPADLRPRVVLPTGSAMSVSIWDAPSPEVLLAWLNENLQYDAVHDVHEVQEDFSWGLTFELTRLRAAEKVAAGSRGALGKISATAAKASAGLQSQLEALDQRSGIISAAENAFSRMRGTGGAASATPAPSFTGASHPSVVDGVASGGEGGVQQSTTSQVLAANMTAGLSKASSTFSWLGTQLREQLLATKATSDPSTSSSVAPPAYYTASSVQSDVPATFNPPSYSGLFASMTTSHAPQATAPPRPQRIAEDDDGAPLATLDTLDTLLDEHDAGGAAPPQLPVSLPPATTPGAGPAAGAGGAAARGAAAGGPPLPTSSHAAGAADTAGAKQAAPMFTLDEDDNNTKA